MDTLTWPKWFIPNHGGVKLFAAWIITRICEILCCCSWVLGSGSFRLGTVPDTPVSSAWYGA